MRIKVKTTALFLAASTCLLGCTGEQLPACSDKKTLAVLDKIAKDAYQKMRRDPNDHEWTVTTIRTRDTNSKTGAHSCAADFVIHNPKNNKTQTIAFTYLIEKLDNSADLFHVQAQELITGINDNLFWGRVDDKFKSGPSKGF